MAWPVTGVIFGLVSFWVAFSNLAVLAGVLKSRLQGSKDFKVIDVTDFITLQIAFADFAYGFIAFMVLALTNSDVRTSDTVCALSSANITMAPLFSIYGLALMAYYRYTAVKNAMSGAGLSLKKVAIITGIMWVFCLLFGLVSHANPLHSASNLYCYPESTTARQLIAFIIIYAPSVAIFVFYCKITKSIKMCTVDQKVPRSVARMILAINLVYIASLFPYGGVNLYTIIVGHQAPAVWDAATLTIACMNYAANPILYCTFQEKYRRAVFYLVGIKFVVKPATMSSTAGSKVKSVNVASRKSKISPMEQLAPDATVTTVMPSQWTNETDTEACPA